MCIVTTAKALDAAMQKEVEGALAGFLKKGEKAQITYKVIITFHLFTMESITFLSQLK